MTESKPEHQSPYPDDEEVVQDTGTPPESDQ